MKLAAVIPTLGERPELGPLVTQLAQEGIDTLLLADPKQNLYAKWNQGAAWAAGLKADAVAILNDDIVLPPDTLATMYDMMIKHDFACVGVDHRAKFGIADKLDMWEITGWVGQLMLEITGWCFMVRAGRWQQIDEGYEWWWGNGDLFVKIAEAGGRLGQIKGLGITHVNEGTARNHPWTEAAKKRDALRWKKLHR